MRMTSFAAAGLLLAGIASIAVAQDAKEKAKADGQKPAESPGWMVIEENWWYPLRFDAVTAMNNAQYHYRRDEEKAAAGEIRKGVNWLKFAAGHAMPITREKLESAEAELTTLARDLEAGKVADASRLDGALGRASHALAEWHFYKAKESYGKNEAGDAARDLEAAVVHLQHAANSAHYQYGPDTITMFESVRKNGKMVTEKKTIDNNLLGKHLDGIEQAVTEIADTLKNSSTDVAKTTRTTPATESKQPAASPGWVVVEEDWWYPFRFAFLNSLHRARVHYRAREENAASAEIDKAITWLKYAQNHADKLTAEELSTARADLVDLSMALKSGKPIVARNLDATFAHASAALARHHQFKADKSLAKGDLKTAGRHLMAAADHLRAAARSANHEYGKEVVTIYDEYAPHGYWDETIEFTRSQLGANLTTIQNELTKLGEKLKAGK